MCRHDNDAAPLTTPIAVGDALIAAGDTLRCPGRIVLRFQPPPQRLSWWPDDWDGDQVALGEGRLVKILGIVNDTVVVAPLDHIGDGHEWPYPFAQPNHRFFFSRRTAQLWRNNVFEHKRALAKEQEEASDRARRSQEERRRAQDTIDRAQAIIDAVEGSR